MFEKNFNVIFVISFILKSFYQIPLTWSKTYEGDYYISERPWSPNCLGADSHAIKIRVEHATKYTMASMGKRYCFAFGNFIKIEYEKYKGMHLPY